MTRWLSLILLLLWGALGVLAQSDALPNLAKTNILTLSHPNGWEVSVERGDVVAKSDLTNVLFDVYTNALYAQAGVPEGNLAGLLAYWYTPNDPSKAFDATRIRQSVLGRYDALLYGYEDSFNNQAYERLLVAFTLENGNIVFVSAVPRTGYVLTERETVLDMVASTSLPEVSFVTLRDGAIVGVPEAWSLKERTSDRLRLENDTTRLQLVLLIRRDVQRLRANTYTRLLQRYLTQNGIAETLDPALLTRTTLLNDLVAVRYAGADSVYYALYLKNGSGVVVALSALGTAPIAEADALKIIGNITATAPRSTAPLSSGAP